MIITIYIYIRILYIYSYKGLYTYMLWVRLPWCHILLPGTQWDSTEDGHFFGGYTLMINHYQELLLPSSSLT